MFAPGAGSVVGPVAGATALLSVVFLFAGSLALLGLLIALGVFLVFLLVFFRDPERAPGPGIVSAADGRVTEVAEEGDRVRVAVFMNVTDVHVNRFPLDGTVLAIDRSGEGYRPAFGVDARHNVQLAYRLETEVGEVEVVELTGLLARRLVPLVAVGDHRAKGDRLGMIVLGSRVDVLLPKDPCHVTVRKGDRVVAGATTIARVRR